MSYQWTASQRARLVPGARLGGRHVVIGPAWLVGDHWRVDVETWHKGLYLENADPSALRPPTLAWLRSMARRKLGKGAVVGYVRDGDGIHVFEQGSLIAYFADRPCDEDGGCMCARSSCSLWLAALPEVTP